MSKQVDEKVVSMQFDNKNFETNVNQSLSTLDKLKSKLNLTGAAKGLENVGAAAKDVKLSPISEAVEQVGVKFDAMQVIATAALWNITNSAVNTGKRLISSLSIDQVTAGWAKYGEKTASVQTIMNATGKSIDEVNEYLNKLMWFSDETSYGFTDMTAALGQLTSAGGDIDKLIPMITGIANATAYAGKGSSEFSRAIYNLNQSYSAGSLQYMDWKSLELAGIASQELKQTFIDIGVELGKISEGEVTIANFGQTLSDKWADTEVMEAAFGKFGEMTEKAYEMVQNGEVDSATEAYAILSEQYDGVAITAAKAAQEAKTFSEALDATKDAVSSGWMTTFEIIFGNYEEAKALWTDLANTLWDVFASGSEARNEMLQEWKDLGGRDDLIQSVKNIWGGLSSIIKPIKEAFRDIFPKTTADQLYKITNRIKEITEKFKLSEKASENLKNTFKGLFALLDIGLTVVKSVISAVSKLFGGVSELSGGILGVTGALGNYIVGLRDSIKESKTFGTILGNIADILKSVFKRFVEVIGYINQKLVAPGFQIFYKILLGIWKVLQWIGSKIKQVLSSMAEGLKEAFSNGDLANATTLLSGGLLVVILKKVKDFIENLKNPLEEFSGIMDSIKGVLGTVGDALKAWQQDLQAKTLLKIAGAIAILAAAILVISTIDEDRLAASLGAMTTLFAQLMGSLAIFARIAGKVKGVAKASTAMITLSMAMIMLATALKIISSIDGERLKTGLVGLTGVFALLLGVLAVMSKIKNNGMNRHLGDIMAIASSLFIIAVSLKILSTISWDGVGRSLTAMAGVFTILAGTLAVMSQIKSKGMSKHVGTIAAMSASLFIIAVSLKILSTISWDGVGRSLTAMAGVFTILVGTLAIMAQIKSKGMNKHVGTILTIAASLVLIAAALKIVGSMSLEGIGKGLLGLGVALGVITGVLAILGAVGPMSIVGAAAILVVSLALAKLTVTLIALSIVPVEALSSMFSALAVGFMKLGGAGLVLLLGIPAILLLAATLPLIGVGLMAAGKGLLWIGAGLTTLSASLTVNVAAIVAGLTMIIQGIIGLIPSIITAIGKGIISILNIIAQSGAAIFDAVSTILVAIANALIKAIPTFVDAVFKLLDTLLQKLIEYVPKLVDAGVKLIVALLNGIAQKIGDIIAAGVNVVTSFMAGIAKAIPDLVAAGFDMIVQLLNGLANTIREKTYLLIDAMNDMLNAAAEAIGAYIGNFTQVGGQIVSGLVKGIKNSMSGVGDALLSGVKSAWSKVTGFFGIHSPSRLATEAGMYIDEGLAVGLNKYANVAGDAATDVAKETSTSLSDALSNIPNVMDSDMQPTIRPVLDLSDVESGANEINDLFGLNPSVGVLSNVNAIGSSMNKNQNGSYDIVSAIKDLSRKVAGSTGTVYNINGVTYDDGSAVASAVGSLVRAARIERRI